MNRSTAGVEITPHQSEHSISALVTIYPLLALVVILRWICGSRLRDRFLGALRTILRVPNDAGQSRRKVERRGSTDLDETTQYIDTTFGRASSPVQESLGHGSGLKYSTRLTRVELRRRRIRMSRRGMMAVESCRDETSDEEGTPVKKRNMLYRLHAVRSKYKNR